MATIITGYRTSDGAKVEGEFAPGKVSYCMCPGPGPANSSQAVCPHRRFVPMDTRCFDCCRGWWTSILEAMGPDNVPCPV